ncbi:MAG: type IV secretory system conjugative DNA transfer family protein, partial [Acidimicrobiales bacterium]
GRPPPRRRVAGRPGPVAGARWATARQLRTLRTTGRAPGRLVLGRLDGTRRVTLAAEPRQSVAVLGPTQSGKTTALAIPAILGWDGPVVASSVKTDLAAATWAWREEVGRVWCVDPTGATGLPPTAWSPLRAAASWAGARRVAADLTEVSRGPGTTPDGDFWYATAAKLLAPLLFAAAHGGRSMADVVRWVDTQEVAEVAALLDAAGVPAAIDAARATWLRDDRARSGVYTTAETVLEPFAEPPAEPLSGPGPVGGRGGFDPEQLLAGPHTLYLCAPAHDQRRLAAVFTSVVKEVLDAAFTASSKRRAPLAPPLLVVLDEAANISPLAELDGLAATCAGHGVQLLTVWQDMAQIAARYGPRGGTVLNNHRAKVFLSGTTDPATLEHASRLVGDEEALQASVTRDATGGVSTTRAPGRRPLLAPERLRQLRPGAGLLVYGHLPPARLLLRPWWEDEVLARRGTPAP